jgi:hypothetical protein
MEPVANLAYEDISRADGFTAVLLHTAPLGIRISAVAAGSLTFLMSHGLLPEY